VVAAAMLAEAMQAAAIARNSIGQEDGRRFGEQYHYPSYSTRKPALENW
jgi:hypothetical protein